MASICKELLYIDHYYRAIFQNEFDRENAARPDAGIRISFAHNARTICVAFVSFVARYMQGNITDQALTPLFASTLPNSITDLLYDAFKNLGNVQHLFDKSLLNNKDKYESILKKLS